MIIHNFKELEAMVRQGLLKAGDEIRVRAAGPGQEARVKYYCGGREGITFSVGSRAPEFFAWGDIIEVEVHEKTLWDFLME